MQEPNSDIADSSARSSEASKAREAQLDNRISALLASPRMLRQFVAMAQETADDYLALNRVRVEMLIALEAAYTRFGDFRHEWKGRTSPEGQWLLSQMRDAISAATGRDAQEVQDDYGTRAARAEASV